MFWNDKNVYCYGVFDLFHAGHVRLLKRAKDLGKRLIVGIVMDRMVRKQKGKNRPIINELDRGLIVSSLNFVDRIEYQLQFDPTETIRALHNSGIYINKLVLGEDQNHISEENKKILKEKYLVEIITLPRTEGISTSDIIKKITGENNATHK